MISEENINRLVDTVRSTPRYQGISKELVQQVGALELAKGRSFKEAVKATRNKIHQVGGAYQEHAVRYAAWLAELKDIPGDPADARLRDFCRRMMGEHASTRERLAVLDQFYSTILGPIAPLHSVADLACGFNPLALPWIPLADDAPYYGCDIYADLADFFNAFLTHLGRPGKVEVCDLTHNLPAQPVQLALLLKTLPCLEQVNKDIGLEFLDRVQADYLLVSFPVASLSGRSKGMLKNYADHFLSLIDGRPWSVQRFEFSSELAFLVKK
jgi:16S rRNA (guanine(1405)-N(7))-methyltransferase